MFSKKSPAIHFNSEMQDLFYTDNKFSPFFAISVIPDTVLLSISIIFSCQVASAQPSSATATSLTLVSIGPVMISPSSVFSA